MYTISTPTSFSFKYTESAWGINIKLLNACGITASQCFKHWDECYSREDAIITTLERLLLSGWGMSIDGDNIIGTPNSEDKAYSEILLKCLQVKEARILKKRTTKLKNRRSRVVRQPIGLFDGLTI
jgi:hypothetical protein